MKIVEVKKSSRGLKGRFSVPGDKSISHRALMFGSIAEGKTRIKGLLNSEDVKATKNCLRQMGVAISESNEELIVTGIANGFNSAHTVLDCANSGTSMRVLAGLFSGYNVDVLMTGDLSLQGRPMKRISEPLSLMGAEISFEKDRIGLAPFFLKGHYPLKPIDYELTISSAQIKTSILLAALRADGLTTLMGKTNSRDHTERMLAQFGVDVVKINNVLSIRGNQKLTSADINVPGDFSSAAFWLLAATIVPDSEIVLENVSLNPTRIAFMNVLKRMGAQIEVEEVIFTGEPVGHICVKSVSHLTATEVSEAEIPFLIDEVPLIGIAGCFAHGKTVVTGAQELTVKESNRLKTLGINLNKMGVDILISNEGFEINGPQKLNGADIESFSDHRVAMGFSIAGLLSDSSVRIHGAECVAVSYENFFETLNKIK